MGPRYSKYKYTKNANELCSYPMGPTERQCYLDRYPDVRKIYGPTDLDGAQTHWEKIGCNQNRNNSCPAPKLTSGAYTFQGCFKSKMGYTQAIPTKEIEVKDIDKCREIAQRKKKNVFGVQNNGTCYTGNDVNSAKNFGEFVDKALCGNLGAYGSNQVYALNSPIPVPPPPVPKFGPARIAEKFENNNGDSLDQGFNNLYNQIFCDLYYTDDDFHVCNNCQLTGAQKVWKTTKKSSANECKDDCRKDLRCTSYNFNPAQSNKDNCIQYYDFPTDIKENVKNNYAVYKLNYKMDYNKLSSAQKNNVKKTCSDQILNNYSHPNTIYKSCISDVSEKNNVSTINFKDAECVYGLLEKQGIKKEKNIDNYELNTSITSKSDPLIDNYQKEYNNITTIQVQNGNINSVFTPDDNTYTEYNNTIKEENNLLENKLSETISNLENDQIDRTDLILTSANDTKKPITTEGFSNIEKNYNNNFKSNSTKFFMFMIFIIFLFLLFIYFRK